MITSKNIGILLDFIKNSKKNSDLYLLVKKNSISLSSKRKSNFYIKNNNLVSKVNISKFYQSILNILLPILRKNKKLVIAQIGQSIDGRIALNNGNSHYINNPKSIIYLHCLRSISDAIIVGSNTIKKDDPLLTTRKIKGTNPKRIIIDGSLSLNNKYKIFNDGNENIIFTKSNKNIGAVGELRISCDLETTESLINSINNYESPKEERMPDDEEDSIDNEMKTK